MRTKSNVVRKSNEALKMEKAKQRRDDRIADKNERMLASALRSAMKAIDHALMFGTFHLYSRRYLTDVHNHCDCVRALVYAPDTLTASQRELTLQCLADDKVQP